MPLITHSPAFVKDGLLIVTFDEADTDGPDEDVRVLQRAARARRGAARHLRPGGGRIGTVLVSPFIRPGTVSAVPYNHYSTPGTIEDLFGLPKLGQAATVSATFGRDVFSGYKAPGAA